MAFPSIDTVIVGAPRHDCPLARTTTPLDAGSETFTAANEFVDRTSAVPLDAVESEYAAPAPAGDTTMDVAAKTVSDAAPGDGVATSGATAVTLSSNRFRSQRH